MYMLQKTCKDTVDRLNSTVIGCHSFSVATLIVANLRIIMANLNFGEKTSFDGEMES